MATIEDTEDVRPWLGASKHTQNTRGKIAYMKLNDQNVDKTTPLSQDPVTFIKEGGNYWS